MAIDAEAVERLVREEPDPVELARRLKEIFDPPPAALPAFKDGEAMQMHEFVARFKRARCGGNEQTFWRWPVRVVFAPDGEIMLAIGTRWTPQIAEAQSERRGEDEWPG